MLRTRCTGKNKPQNSFARHCALHIRLRKVNVSAFLAGWSACVQKTRTKRADAKRRKRKNYCVSSALTVLGLCNSRSSAMIDGCDLVAPTAADLLHDQLTSTVLYGRAERTGAAKHLTAATTHCTVCYGGVGHSWKIFYSMVRLPSGGEN